MAGLSSWGNALHSGEKSYPIVQRRALWFTISGVLMVLSIALLLIRGLTFGIDFTGGSQWVVTGSEVTDTQPALDVATEVLGDAEARATELGLTDGTAIRLQVGDTTQEQQGEISDGLASAYGVTDSDISFDLIGPTWGQEVGAAALQGLVIFLILVTIVMSLYFRAWRMAVAGLAALAHDLLFTVGIYALVGFEVTPASVIGFLTVLGYSLYDTVVVFDKVRENTENVTSQKTFTYAEQANLAVNQTLVRSINTSVVALLPVSAILFIGSFVLGAGTLRDISLALFVGMAVGTYSSIFVATPLEVALRGSEPRIKEHTAMVLAAREAGESHVTVREDGTVQVGALAPGIHKGVAAQPRRKRRGH